MIREYPIETGLGGVGKKRGGDHRTPVGDYEISWIASRNSLKGYRRLVVRPFRIVYRIEKDSIIINCFEHRKKAYKR